MTSFWLIFYPLRLLVTRAACPCTTVRLQYKIQCNSRVFIDLHIVWLHPEGRILSMYIMTSLSWMFARIVVLTFVASNERQARLIVPQGYCPSVWVYARVLLLTFRSDFQRPFEFQDSEMYLKANVSIVWVVAKNLLIVLHPFPFSQSS